MDTKEHELVNAGRVRAERRVPGVIRRRCFIISAVLLTIVLGFVAALWYPPAKRIIVPMGYSTVTNKIAQWQPARVRRNGLPSDVCAVEKVPGSLYYRSIFERGDPKFGPFTVVRVSKLDETNTTVELNTTQYALCGLLGKRHIFFIERRRWEEIREVLRQ
ncbi:MAG: hypothetical protein P4N60_22865 [Verrucomicrobiae bacterium]|nr:hypothetical protein [Verrucomicrobiae bacterium]